MESNLTKSKKIIGICSSLYMAIAYIAGITIFIVVLRYPEITEIIDKVKIIVEMKSKVFITNLLMYVLFGPVLVLFIISLNSLINNENSFLLKFSSIIGFIWAGSLTASGMIANGAINPISKLFSQNPEQAVQLWQMLDTVSIGLGNGNGEILGGIMTFCFGLVMLINKKFSKGLSIYGIIVGLIGVISLIPGLTDLTALFGIMQLIWFILISFTFYKKRLGL